MIGVVKAPLGKPIVISTVMLKTYLGRIIEVMPADDHGLIRSRAQSLASLSGSRGNVPDHLQRGEAQLVDEATRFGLKDLAATSACEIIVVDARLAQVKNENSG